MIYSFFDGSLTSGIDGRPDYHVRKNEKGRLMQVPNDALGEIHKRLLVYLREHLVSDQLSPSSHRSIWDCVTPHCGRRFILHTDIKKAYQSIDLVKMVQALAAFDPQIDLKNAERVAIVTTFLREYCFFGETSLLTGAGASQDLFNLYCEVWIDEDLRQYCDQEDVVYTRYVDDLTFSSVRKPIGQKRRRAIYEIIRRHGFTLNDAKTKWIDAHKQTIEICGLTIGNESPDRVRLSRKRKKVISKKVLEAQTGVIEKSVLTGHMTALLYMKKYVPKTLSSGEIRIILRYRSLVRKKKYTRG